MPCAEVASSASVPPIRESEEPLVCWWHVWLLLPQSQQIQGHCALLQQWVPWSEPASNSIGYISDNALRLYQPINPSVNSSGTLSMIERTANECMCKQVCFSLCTSCPSQVWVSEGGCVVWHSAVSFASFLAGKVGGGCDHEEVTRTYFGCSPYTELLVARSTCDKWSKTCVFNWMAVINLRLRDLFYFLRMHGAGGSILVHDHKGVQLAGVVSAMILMVVEGCSAGTAVSWLL